jgi:hypothetical protein
MQDKPLRKREDDITVDPLDAAFAALDADNPKLNQALRHGNDPQAWSIINNDRIQDAVVEMDVPEKIEEMRRLGYYFDTEIQSKLQTVGEKSDITLQPYEHRSTFTGKRLGTMYCLKAKYKQRYEKGCEQKQQAWTNGQFGFAPYNGHSTRPPKGSKVEVDHEDYFDER